MDLEKIKTEIKIIMVETLELEIDYNLINENVHFYSELGLDSLSILNLVVAIEERFNITIDDDELRVELFDNINMISEYVYTTIINQT